MAHFNESLPTVRRHQPSSEAMHRNSKTIRKIEKLCCSCLTCIPLGFVYSLTTWAVWVQVHIGSLPAEDVWTGRFSATLAFIFYVLLNWSYTCAVFTDPGSPSAGYNSSAHNVSGREALTAKSTGGLRFCKKCSAVKPDRTHHCSSCQRCVLKMDHHCPWLATCVGLRNYKPFLLFLVYTCLFCWVGFAAAVTWVWKEILIGSDLDERLMPVNYVMLSVIAGIIGLVLSGFTGWHLYLSIQGRTTIESLEQTRYLSPLRTSLQNSISNTADRGSTLTLGQQLREIHANTIPGVTRVEEGEADHLLNDIEHSSATALDPEAWRERERYENYLDERDSERMPNAFDLGWRRNLLHVFGPNPLLWGLPICNTDGDGWYWPVNPKWREMREELARKRYGNQWRSAGDPNNVSTRSITPLESQNFVEQNSNGQVSVHWGTHWNDVPDEMLGSSIKAPSRFKKEHIRPNGH